MEREEAGRWMEREEYGRKKFDENSNKNKLVYCIVFILKDTSNIIL